MVQYLLSTFTTEAQEPPASASPEEMQAMMERIVALEAKMDASGTFVFGGHLHSPGAATVVDGRPVDVIMSDGPFVESKEHVAGFHIINADDLDAALGWASKVLTCVGRPIEVRPFAGTGGAADQLPG